MAGKRYTAEQIIGHLSQAEIPISEGKTVAEVVRELGVSEQTYYRWRKEYGGMEVDPLQCFLATFIRSRLHYLLC